LSIPLRTAPTAPGTPKLSCARLEGSATAEAHHIPDCRSRFKVYKSQIPVIEQAIETAALMLGSDKSRGYCLEMICADFLAGAHMDGGNPEMLLQSISRYYRFLPSLQQQAFLSEVNRKTS
jgi:hypothetical protein